MIYLWWKLKKKTERGIEGGITEGWEKSVAVCSLGRYGGEKRMGLSRRLEMKELSPERAIIHSWTERGSWIRRCTRARFRGMGGVLRGNSRLVISIAMESTLDSQNRKSIVLSRKINSALINTAYYIHNKCAISLILTTN